MNLIRLATCLALLWILTDNLQGGTVFTINSGTASLAIQLNSGKYDVAIQLTNGSAVYQQTNLMAVEVVNASGGATWLTAPYSAMLDLGGGVYKCTGNITSANGSVFSFADTFKAQDNAGAFQVDRSVVVSKANFNDIGFSTKLAFQRSVAGRMTDYDFFMPSIWYGTNGTVNTIALANTMTDYYYWYREDRMPLPLFMLRQKDNGATFSVTHNNPNGSTFAGEDYLNRIIDGRMQFASLGMENNAQPSVGMLFPGTEGERTLILGGSTNKNWALRSHPVTANFTQTYSLVMRLTTEPDFVTALEHTWTAAYTQFHPATYNCDLNQIYSDAVNVLDRYWKSINAAAGEPFRVPFPSGIITNQLDYSYDLGFVGMQLPNAEILIRAGFNTTNAVLRSEGEQMVEFWASNSLTSAGCPKTWYDPYSRTWRTYPTYVRVACDGMLGMLWAWNQEKKHGVEKNNWVNTCTRFGDWLISRQNADGSIARAFDYNSNQPTEAALNNTSHLVRYLTELYLATGVVRYQQAAVKAGGYIYTNVYQDFSYVGGTPDNPNVPDKEAASMALRAFTALYDLTGDNHWLTAAVQTAYYYSTWIYSWNVPIPTGDAVVVYPPSRSTTGLSVIATSNFGCDSYAATDAFEFYRLYLFTGDTNLLNEAKMMLYNTKQPLNWDRANPLSGYGDPGIINEALSIVTPRGHGVNYHLPWQTANYMEPMINLFDTFGAYSIDTIEQQPLATRQTANDFYSNARGYVTAQTAQDVSTLVHRYSFSETSGTTCADSVGGWRWNGTLPNGGTFSGGQLSLAAAGSQYLKLPGGILSNYTAVTIEAWVAFPDQLPVNCCLFDFGNSSGSSGLNYILCAPRAGRAAITGSDYSGEQNAYGNFDFSYHTNFHITAVFNPPAGSLTLYTNGAVAAVNNSVTTLFYSVNDVYSYIGKSLSSAGPYPDLTLDEFRIYNGALDASQVAATDVLGPNQLLSNASPAITVTAGKGNLNLSWPLAAAGFRLMSSTNLASGIWTAVTSPAPQIVGRQWQVTLTYAANAQYYRLQQ